MTGIYGIDYYNNYSLTGNYGYGYSTGAVSSARSEEKGMIVNPGKSDVEKPGTLPNRTQLPAGISLHFSLYNKLPYEILFRIPLLPVNLSAENLEADYGTHLQSH